MGKLTLLIAGASGGIGSSLYHYFLDKGNEVHGTFFKHFPKTVCNNGQLEKLDISIFEDVKNWLGKIDLKNKNLVLINCIGINYNIFLHKAEMEEWKRVIDINLVGSVNLIHNILPYMRKNEFGRIINFSSVVAQKPVLGTSAYAASKSALWGLAKTVALENAIKNITINNINLGYFDIGMIKDVAENVKEAVLNQVPSNKFGNIKDIFSTIEYIINTPYLNGSSIDLNGGLY